MKLYEYQVKPLLGSSGIRVPLSGLAENPEEAVRLGSVIGYPVVLKAQILSGGRGKAGGIRLTKNALETEMIADSILHSTIKNHQVKKVLVEKAVEIDHEFYISFTYDRRTAQQMMIFSNEGGIDIEEVAEKRPELIIKILIEPLLGLQDYQIRLAAFQAKLAYSHWKQFLSIVKSLWSLFVKSDATLLEINPLVLDSNSCFIALDGKMSIDDNAIFRHPEFLEFLNQETANTLEEDAKREGLNYIQLTGDIGCMVNGAGLAMATMDSITKAGGKPANFLDIGGGATSVTVSKALELIRADSKVKVILINVFGGITRCDEVAKGILNTRVRPENDLPIILRLEGTNAIEGRLLLESTTCLVMTDTLMKAAKLAVAASKGTP